MSAVPNAIVLANLAHTTYVDELRWSDHPQDDILGRYFIAATGVIYFCDSHDRSGYWMTPARDRGERINISDNAIGRTFHRLHRLPSGEIVTVLLGATLDGFVFEEDH